jgi:hypothetical protein
VTYGLPLCACCGSIDGVEGHHLYLRADGCPDDLTVWLCHVCHGRAHGMSRRMNIRERTKAALAAAKARGVTLGNPNLAEAQSKAAAIAQAEADRFATSMRSILDSLGAIPANAMARELNARHVTTASGGKWSASTVLRVQRRLKEPQS